MKTFLHYTKERELDEGFMDTLGGAAEKVGETIKDIRKNPFMSLLQPGAGGAALGGAFAEFGERRKECRETSLQIRTKDLPRARTRLSALKARGAPQDEIDSQDELIDSLDKKLKELGNCSNP
jgi:hypothetical protein